MSELIVKLKDPVVQKDWYLLFSTVVDNFTTFGMSLEELTELIKEEYGNQGLRELHRRLERVELYGTSSLFKDTPEEVVRKMCSNYTVEEVLEYLCRRQEELPEKADRGGDD